MSYFYILELKPLSVPSFANIFSHSVGCLLVLIMVSFAVQKLVSLIASICLFSAFISISWTTDLRKYWEDLCLRLLCCGLNFDQGLGSSS